MKRAHVIRCAAVVAAIALVAACDQRSGLAPKIRGGGGTSGGAKGAPAVSIDTVRPSPVNIGDSIFVAVHVKSDSSMTGLLISGLTVKGSVHMSFSDAPSYVTSLGRQLLGGVAGLGSVSLTDMTAMTGDAISAFVSPALGGGNARSLEQVLAGHPTLRSNLRVAAEVAR